MSPWAHERYGEYIVDIDLDSVGIVSCNPPTIEVCGRVATIDGRFDQRLCTKIYNSRSLAKALEEYEERIREELCGEADNPEMCIEYYSDIIDEMACEKIDPEDVLSFIDFEELVEALVHTAEDHLPERKGLLKWIQK